MELQRDCRHFVAAPMCRTTAYILSPEAPSCIFSVAITPPPRQQAAAKAVARQSELAVRQVPAGDVVGALLRPGAAGPGPGGSGAGPEGSPARRLRAPGRPAGAGGEGPVAAGGAAGRAPHALNPRRAVGTRGVEHVGGPGERMPREGEG